MVASRRRTKYPSISLRLPKPNPISSADDYWDSGFSALRPRRMCLDFCTCSPLFLLDVPQEGYGRDQDARDVGAIGGGNDELRGRDERNGLPGVLLHLVAELLLRCRIGGIEPRVAQFLHLGIGRPAEPPLLAVAAQGIVDGGIGHVGAHQPGMKNIPASLVDRFLDRAAVNQGAPVVGGELDVYAGGAQELGGYESLAVHDRLIGGGKHHDLLTLVAGVLYQLLGLGHVALAGQRL